MAERIHRDPVLRCDLVITHQDQERLRSIYRSQNLRLGTENISETAKGFLSRLRVDVKPNRTSPGQDDAIRDMDLVFLHDAVSQHAKPIWDLERGPPRGSIRLLILLLPKSRVADSPKPTRPVLVSI